MYSTDDRASNCCWSGDHIAPFDSAVISHQYINLEDGKTRLIYHRKLFSFKNLFKNAGFPSLSFFGLFWVISTPYFLWLRLFRSSEICMHTLMEMIYYCVVLLARSDCISLSLTCSDRVSPFAGLSSVFVFSCAVSMVKRPTRSATAFPSFLLTFHAALPWPTRTDLSSWSSMEWIIFMRHTELSTLPGYRLSFLHMCISSSQPPRSRFIERSQSFGTGLTMTAALLR